MVVTGFYFHCARSDMFRGQIRLVLPPIFGGVCVCVFFPTLSAWLGKSHTASFGFMAPAVSASTCLRENAVCSGSPIIQNTRLWKGERRHSLRNVLSHSMHSSVCTWPQLNAGCKAQHHGHKSPSPSLSWLVLACQPRFPASQNAL